MAVPPPRGVAFQMTKKSMFSAPNVVAGTIQIVQWYQGGPSRESGNAKNAKIEELFPDGESFLQYYWHMDRLSLSLAVRKKSSNFTRQTKTANSSKL